MVARSILPITSYLAVTAPLGGRLQDAISYAGAVGDTRRVFEYHRVVGGDRLLWGGHVNARLSPPEQRARILRRDIHRVYPQLGKIEITHAWSGVMGFAVHKMPQVGEVSPGLWVASGFGGHGINTSAMAGDLIARAIVEGDDRWRLFSSYDLVWAGGMVGRVAAQILYWSKQARDVLDEMRARVERRPEAATNSAEPAALTTPEGSESGEHSIGDMPASGSSDSPLSKGDMHAHAGENMKKEEEEKTVSAPSVVTKQSQRLSRRAMNANRSKR
jgi:hypothetical protein